MRSLRGARLVARKRLSVVLEVPTLDEFDAVLAAVQKFHQKMHPREKRLARDLVPLLDELIEAAQKLRAVTRGPEVSRDGGRGAA